MRSDAAEDRSLYAVLGEPPPPGTVRGETRRSAGKETVDRDVEMLVIEELMDAP